MHWWWRRESAQGAIGNLGWIPTYVSERRRLRFGFVRLVHVKNPSRPGEPLDYAMTPLTVLANGELSVRLQWGGVVSTVEQLRVQEADGTVLLAPPVDAWVTDVPLARLRVGLSQAAPGDLVREVEDVVEQLQGQPSRLARARSSIEHSLAQAAPSIDGISAAYEALPLHQRPFLISMDAKDGPVRRLLAAKDGGERDEAWNDLRDAWSDR